MYFPIAGIEVNPFVPPLVAFVISFFASMGGISGAFLLLPFQMSFLGYVHPSVSATNQVFNIVAIPSGVYRYWKEGRLVWPLVWIVVLGTLPGVFIGAIVRVAYLPDARHFKLFAAMVLFYLSAKILADIRQKPAKDNAHSDLQKKVQESQTHGVPQEKACQVTHIHLRSLGFRFYDAHYTVPLWGIFGLSFLVGIVGGVYGIGGGAIIAPFFVTFFKLPIYIVAGATLMGTFVTSIAGVSFYHAIAPYYPQFSIAPDWLLGLLFGIGGALGMYCGARCQKFVPATAIKWLLAISMLFTAGKYVYDFLLG